MKQNGPYCNFVPVETAEKDSSGVSIVVAINSAHDA